MVLFIGESCAPADVFSGLITLIPLLQVCLVWILPSWSITPGPDIPFEVELYSTKLCFSISNEVTECFRFDETFNENFDASSQMIGVLSYAGATSIAAIFSLIALCVATCHKSTSCAVSASLHICGAVFVFIGLGVDVAFVATGISDPNYCAVGSCSVLSGLILPVGLSVLVCVLSCMVLCCRNVRRQMVYVPLEASPVFATVPSANVNNPAMYGAVPYSGYPQYQNPQYPNPQYPNPQYQQSEYQHAEYPPAAYGTPQYPPQYLPKDAEQTH